MAPHETAQSSDRRADLGGFRAGTESHLPLYDPEMRTRPEATPLQILFAKDDKTDVRSATKALSNRPNRFSVLSKIDRFLGATATLLTCIRYIVFGALPTVGR